MVIVSGCFQALSFSPIQIPPLPLWAWVIIWLGIFLGIVLEGAYRLIRKQNDNWIDNYWYEHGKWPPAPLWLTHFVPGLVVAKPIKPLPIQTPSGQQWSRTPPSQQKDLKDYCDWALREAEPGQSGLRSLEDVIWHMEQMQPKTPPGIEKRTWRPYEQH